MRLRDLLEARLRLLVARVEVGVVLARQLAEGRPDLLLAGSPRQAQHVVEVLGLGHRTIYLPASDRC